MGINVLSLFDGISCARVALERAGIEVDNYYSSEVDKWALQIVDKNFPQDRENRLGDVRNIRGEHIAEIDLLIGGSPCTNFSFSGKRNGMRTKDNVEIFSLEHYLQLKEEGWEFEGQSYLFWEYIRLMKEIKPTYFLLENVRMAQKWKDVLTNAIEETLGEKCFLIEINSALVSAQNRKRLYWTNIPNVEQPQDKRIMLTDIVHEGEGHTVVNQGHHIKPTPLEKSHCLLARDYKGWGNQEANSVVYDLQEYIVPFDKTLKILDKEVESGKVGYFRQDSQANRVYYIHGKAITLCGEAGRGAAKMGQYLFGCLTPDRTDKRQNGQRFNGGKKFYTLTAQDRHGILTEGYIRKLTPIECERLQTLEDGFTEGVSNTQRYKALGNGFTVDVIAHILRNIK